MEAADLLGDTDRVGKWGGAVNDYLASYDYAPLAAYGSPSGSRDLSAFCGACCGGIYLVTGRVDEAEEELLKAIAELEASGMRSRCVHPATQLAELRVVQGRLEEARTLLQSFEHLPEAVRPLAALELAEGSAGVASMRLRGRIDQLSEQLVAAFPLCALLVEAETARSDLAGAEWAVERLADVVSTTKSGRHEAELWFARGKLAVARGDADAPALFRDAARRFGEASLPLLACRARMALARALTESERGTAISEARAALAAFDRMGATLDADVAAAFLRDLGVRGRTGPKDIGLLSKREMEVLRLVAEGLSNQEISDRLFISIKTAGHHVSSILTKLGLRSRTEAAAYAALNLERQPASK
jgi:DNA-binding CsgD family transcriptional regulator